MAHIEMSLHSLQSFLNDGKLDAAELAQLVDLAEADGKITQEEVEVLKSVVRRIKPEEIDGDMREQLNKLSAKLGI